MDLIDGRFIVAISKNSNVSTYWPDFQEFNIHMICTVRSRSQLCFEPLRCIREGLLLSELDLGYTEIIANGKLMNAFREVKKLHDRVDEYPIELPSRCNALN